MAIYRTGQASMDAQGYITGYGTGWRKQLTLIRSGATIVFNTTPVSFAVISEVISDTSMRAIQTNGKAIDRMDYVILLHDSLTVDGLAQDVAETLRYYQGKETQFERFIEIVQNMDPEEMGKWLEGVKAEADRAAAEAGKAHQSSLAAQAASTVSSEQADRAKRQVELAAAEVQKAKDQVGLAAAEVTKAAGEVGKAAQEVEKAKAQVELAQNASDFAQSQAENAAESGGFAKTEADRAAAAAKKAEDLANQFDASKTLLKDNNLDDLTDKAAARRNLGVDNITSDDTETRVMTKGKDAWLSLRQADRKWGFWDEAMKSWHALGVEQGGTGAKDAAGARKNIGVDRVVQDANMTRIKSNDDKTELRIGQDEWYVYRDSQDSERGYVELGIQGGGTGAGTVQEAKENFGLDRFQQFGTGETNMKSSDGTKQLFIKNNGSWGAWDNAANAAAPLSIAHGGTGSADVNGARTNLKVDKHVQGSDRTLIQSPQSGDDRYALMVHQSGVWGCYNEKNSQYVALQLDKGGTGAKDAAGARKNIGIDGFGLGLSSGAGAISNATEGSSVNLANGFYATNGDFVGAPFGVGSGQFLGLVSFNCTNGNNYKFQLAGSYSGSGRMFFRSMNNGSYRAWNEIASLQNANTWAQMQTCLSNFKSSASWPALELDKTSIASGTVGRRIVIEHNDSSLNFYFANGSNNTGRYTVMLRRPNNTTAHYVAFDGGLPVDGRSHPSDTGNDFNTVYQGWRNIGGSAVNSPSGAAAANVYGSLFTQCTQGLQAGRAKAQGATGYWWQQRFYDTNNRIYSRIQTNATTWGGWQQITMSAVSDERLKDVKGNLNVEGALDNINRMEFKLFNFKEEMIQGKTKTTRRGVISQQIRTIDKEYVKNVGGYWHLDQTPMLLDGLAAIKALRARDEANKAEIASLKGEIAELKALVNQIISK